MAQKVCNKLCKNMTNESSQATHACNSVKLATLVEVDPKDAFSIATTPWCSGGRYSFPWIAPFYPCSLSYIAEC